MSGKSTLRGLPRAETRLSRVSFSSRKRRTVVSTEGYGDQAEAKIDFGADYGVKHLVLRYAPLEKL